MGHAILESDKTLISADALKLLKYLACDISKILKASNQNLRSEKL